MKRPTVVALAASLTAGLTSCGGGGATPTSSSAADPARSSGLAQRGASSLSTATLSGKILDAFSGAPIEGARIEIPERGATGSGPEGEFSIAAATTVVSLVVEAPGYVRRETRARAGGAPLVVELFPEDGRFDLDFFDHVFRDLGEDGTHPWSSEPAFQILSHTFDCAELDHQGYCELYEATTDEAPEQFLNLARDVVATDAALYTGGSVSGLNVSIVHVAPGTTFRRSEAWVRDTVRIVLLQLPNDYSWATYWYYRGPRDMYSGLISINKRHKALRGVYSHELAHTLGYAHPRGGHEVPLPSIMRYGHGDGPEENDLFHGRLLYRRPAGSRTPDVDPPGFVLNALRHLDAAPGELVEVNVR